MTGRWYHRNINGIEAQKLLEEYGQDGSFLIRPSQSRNNSFTLSVRCVNNAYKHIKIQNNGDFYDIGEGGDKFATLSELVQHFILKETLRDRNDGTMLVLKYPLSYKEPTTERYYHGAISGAEAENLLLEKGVVGSYLVRESRSSPENYVLSVRCENNKIVHLFVNYTKHGYALQNYEEYYGTLDEFISKLTKLCPIVDSKDNVVYLKQPFNASRMNALSLASRIKDLEKEQQPTVAQQQKLRSKITGFAEEFELLQQQDGRLLYNRVEGEKPENKSKNRFKTILPFDHTRVLLQNGSGSDYINANYIRVDDEADIGKVYIATQGPLPNTVNDFWRMVVMENCKIILMITHECEKGRVKCAKYWPDYDSADHYYDDVKVISHLNICKMLKSFTSSLTECHEICGAIDRSCL
jgi:tyrosine-protein phosphatase non-receptor type 11